MKEKRLIVIGGGAAGFFCAINAARMNPNLEVIIVERTSKSLSKVRVSGGGRCNVTHACFEIEQMIKNYPRGANFVKKAFHHFFTTDTIQWFLERGVALKTEDDGRMFPVTDSSQTIIECLLKEANTYEVQLKMNTEVKSIHTIGNSFEISLSGERLLSADYVCVASGGYPKAGMFDWLIQLGHSIEDPVPSLFTFNLPGNDITRLMGISVETAHLKIAGTKLEQQGPLLITHWGLSGPAILKLSAWGARTLAASNWQFTVLINWLPIFNEHTLREHLRHLRFDLAGHKMIHKNPLGLPQRLWEYFLHISTVNDQTRWADLSAQALNKLVKILISQELPVKGKTTFKEEFVTAGGIKIRETDAQTMKSKLVPNLFFAGEILDVDGITGGFNFQHAWTGGWIAARAIAESSRNNRSGKIENEVIS